MSNIVSVFQKKYTKGISNMGKFEIKEYKLIKMAFLMSANKKLKKAKLPKGITCIEEGAFENCLNLKKVILPTGLKAINQNAFKGCECLETITIPSGVTHIKAGTFKNCRNLTNVEILAPHIELGDEAFSGCENLVTLKMSNDIQGLRKNVFAGCKKLNNIGEKFKKITVNVSDRVSDFSNCELLEEVTILNAFKNSVIFSGSTVTNVTLNEGIEWISDNAFAGCENLKEITIPGTVKRICKNAFANSGLTKVTLNEGLECILESAFLGCKNLTEVAIPSTVKKIESNTFANSGLTKIVLPEGLEVIGDNAFAGCKNLKEITIPSTVKHIYCGAFDTPNMIINYKGTEKQWHDITANFDFAFSKGEVLVDKDPDVKVEGTYMPDHTPFIKEFTENVNGEDTKIFVPLVLFRGNSPDLAATKKEWDLLDEDGFLTNSIIQKERIRLKAGASAVMARPKYIITFNAFYALKDSVVNFDCK